MTSKKTYKKPTVMVLQMLTPMPLLAGSNDSLKVVDDEDTQEQYARQHHGGVWDKEW